MNVKLPVIMALHPSICSVLDTCIGALRNNAFGGGVIWEHLVSSTIDNFAKQAVYFSLLRKSGKNYFSQWTLYQKGRNPERAGITENRANG